MTSHRFCPCLNPPARGYQNTPNRHLQGRLRRSTVACQTCGNATFWIVIGSEFLATKLHISPIYKGKRLFFSSKPTPYGLIQPIHVVVLIPFFRFIRHDACTLKFPFNPTPTRIPPSGEGHNVPAARISCPLSSPSAMELPVGSDPVLAPRGRLPSGSHWQ